MSIPSLAINQAQLLSSQVPAEPKTTKLSSWMCRSVRKMETAFKDLGIRILYCVKRTMIILGKLQMDATSLARMCRLGITAFGVIEKCVGAPGIFTAAISSFATTENIILTISAGDQIKYFGVGKHKRNSELCSIGQGALLAAGVGGAVSLLGKVGLIDFAKIGLTFGNMPIFGAISKLGLSFGSIVSGIAAIGFGFLAVDSAVQIYTAETRDEKNQACIDLAWNISEIALAVFVASGVNHLPTLAALGTIASGLGIASFVHNICVQNKAEKSEQNT